MHSFHGLGDISESLHSLHQKVEKLMTGQADLTAAITGLQTTVASAVTDIQALTQQLTAANANGDDAAFEAAAQQINTVTQQLQTAVGAPGTSPAPSAPTS